MLMRLTNKFRKKIMVWSFQMCLPSRTFIQRSELYLRCISSDLWKQIFIQGKYNSKSHPSALFSTFSTAEIFSFCSLSLSLSSCEGKLGEHFSKCVLLLFHFICIPVLFLCLSLFPLFRNCCIFVCSIHFMHLLSKRGWKKGSLCSTLHWKCWTFLQTPPFSTIFGLLIEFQIPLYAFFKTV